MGAFRRFSALLGLSGVLGSQDLRKLSLLQWNPHWQCVVWDMNNCVEEAGKAFTAELEKKDVDFANLIEYVNPSGILPREWTNVRSAPTCGLDSLDLVYNHVRWAPADDKPAMKGCMLTKPPDRPYVIQELRMWEGGSHLDSRC